MSPPADGKSKHQRIRFKPIVLWLYFGFSLPALVAICLYVVSDWGNFYQALVLISPFIAVAIHSMIELAWARRAYRVVARLDSVKLSENDDTAVWFQESSGMYELSLSFDFAQRRHTKRLSVTGRRGLQVGDTVDILFQFYRNGYGMNVVLVDRVWLLEIPPTSPVKWIL